MTPDLSNEREGTGAVGQRQQMRRGNKKSMPYSPGSVTAIGTPQVEEHLLLYARIKGVPENRLSKVSGDKMQQMDLKPFQTTKVTILQHLLSTRLDHTVCCCCCHRARIGGCGVVCHGHWTMCSTNIRISLPICPTHQSTNCGIETSTTE